MKEQILLVAQDTPRAHLLFDALSLEKYEVRASPASAELAAESADLIVLALESESASTLALCRQLREDRVTAPLLLLMERAGEEADALRQGADDCVAGRFDVPELLARIGALLRRRRDGKLSFGDVRVDLRRGIASTAHGQIGLTPKETSLLSYLAASRGAVIGREELLREVWGYTAAGTRTVDTHMAALRRKLEANPRRPSYLLTIRGQGYQFCE